MTRAVKISENVYQVGGPGLTDAADCMVYLVKGSPSVLIDAGAGASAREILEAVKDAGCHPDSLRYLFLTHCHIDHVGGAHFFREACPDLRLVAHRGDLEALVTADPVKTAANWYGVTLPPLEIDMVIEDESFSLEVAPYPLTLIHAPGHTPGSCVAVMDQKESRVLFGQDIHGPFMEAFDSDILQWKESMERLLSLEADILCEGHYGVFKGKEAVRSFIRQQLSAQGF